MMSTGSGQPNDKPVATTAAQALLVANDKVSTARRDQRSANSARSSRRCRRVMTGGQVSGAEGVFVDMQVGDELGQQPPRLVEAGEIGDERCVQGADPPAHVPQPTPPSGTWPGSPG